MQVAESEGHLGTVEANTFEWKPLVNENLVEDLSSLDEVHDEVQSDLVLEHVVHLDDEWMICLPQNVLLQLCTLQLLKLDDLVFSD